MLIRSPKLQWVPGAARLAVLLPVLAGCGPARNQFAPPCPGQAILADAADYDAYRSGSPTGVGRDLTDLVLHARIVGMQGTCREGDRKNQLAVTVQIGVEVTRGPAMSGQQADVPVFVAVANGDTILDKRAFAMRVAFPSNIDRVTLTPGDVNLVLPVTQAKTGAAYTIVAGFQLTPDQLVQRRQGRK
jgi:hypothetical protein